MTKITWTGTVTSVQPRIRMMRSFDERSHSYHGYLVRLDGTIDSRPGRSQSPSVRRPRPSTAASQIVACYHHAAPQPRAHPPLRLLPFERGGGYVLDRLGDRGLGRLRHLASATCRVLAAAGVAFLFLATRHHPRAQSRRRSQHPVIRHQVLPRPWHQRAKPLQANDSQCSRLRSPSGLTNRRTV